LTSRKKKAGGSGGFFAIIVAFILGFFTYGQTLAGGLGVALLAILETLAAVIGAIPIAGPFIYYLFAGQWALTWTLSFTTLGGTWLTSLIFWVGQLVSVGFSAAATYFTSRYLYRRFRGPRP